MMFELFTVNGLMPLNQRKDGMMIYNCAGKLSLRKKYRLYITGYIMDEDEDHCMVLLENNAAV
eukprot:7343299-Ditylum_brightwellii.AAC.1